MKCRTFTSQTISSDMNKFAICFALANQDPDIRFDDLDMQTDTVVTCFACGICCFIAISCMFNLMLE